jgi:hypothetical protein
LAQPNQAGQSSPLQQGHARQLSQARGADDPLIVFGNAFPAEKLAATSAARHRFPLTVV